MIRRKKTSTKTLKNKLDKLFSLMIRTRDAGKPCISCGKQCDDKQAGHFVPRRHLATRWNPWNVNGECAGCNGFDAMHLLSYYKALERRYDVGTGEGLIKLSRSHWKPQREQLERLILACDSPSDYESEWFAVQREFAAE